MARIIAMKSCLAVVAMFAMLVQSVRADKWADPAIDPLGHIGKDLLTYGHAIYLVAAVLFNTAGAMHCFTWQVFTVNHPNLGSLAVAFFSLWAILAVRFDWTSFYVVVCFVWVLMVLKGGIIQHLKAPYLRMKEYHPHAWKFGVLINIFGAVVYSYGLASSLTCARPAATLAIFVGALALLYLLLKLRSKGEATDGAWYDQTQKDTTRLFKRHVDMRSYYLRMSDGVQLAVDVHLPLWWGKPGLSDEPLPTILHLTRYNRNNRVKPFWYWVLPYINMRSMRYINKVIPRGYAFVSVDVRGSGASFGSRPFDLLPREVEDYQEVLAWVKKQEWCNGRIGTGGISYDGITGTQLAAGGGVSAVAALFSPNDIYSDLVMPGGVQDSGFLFPYARFTSAAERNTDITGIKVPRWYTILSAILVDGVLNVSDEATFDAAIAGHMNNWDLSEQLKGFSFKDDPLVTYQGQKLSAADFGLTQKVLNGLKRNNVAIHTWTGYYDSRSPETAIGLDAQMDPGRHQVTMGPWVHGCRMNASAHSPSTKPAFDVFEDVARFWDAHLKADPEEGSRLMSGPRVHYFTMGPGDEGEVWKESAEWPPSNRHRNVLLLGINNKLLPPAQAASTPGHVDYLVDKTTTSNFASRWNLVASILLQPPKYDNRAEMDSRSLVFTSTILSSDMTITGAPLVQLRMVPLGGTDAAIFAYLEDYDPATGEVVYITEGVMRASNRTSVGPPGQAAPLPADAADDAVVDTTEGRFWGANGIDAGCYHSFLRKHNKPLDSLPPGSDGGSDAGRSIATRVDIRLVTVSYCVPSGHCVRLSLAGADADNFDVQASGITEEAAQWRVFWGTTAANSSLLALPVEGAASAPLTKAEVVDETPFFAAPAQGGEEEAATGNGAGAGAGAGAGTGAVAGFAESDSDKADVSPRDVTGVKPLLS